MLESVTMNLIEHAFPQPARATQWEDREAWGGNKGRSKRHEVKQPGASFHHPDRRWLLVLRFFILAYYCFPFPGHLTVMTCYVQPTCNGVLFDEIG